MATPTGSAGGAALGPRGAGDDLAWPHAPLAQIAPGALAPLPPQPQQQQQLAGTRAPAPAADAGPQPLACRVPGCTAVLQPAAQRRFNRRGRACDAHLLALSVDLGDGALSRFCQARARARGAVRTYVVRC